MCGQFGAALSRTLFMVTGFKLLFCLILLEPSSETRGQLESNSLLGDSDSLCDITKDGYLRALGISEFHRGAAQWENPTAAGLCVDLSAL